MPRRGPPRARRRPDAPAGSPGSARPLQALHAPHLVSVGAGQLLLCIGACDRAVRHDPQVAPRRALALVAAWARRPVVRVELGAGVDLRAGCPRARGGGGPNPRAAATGARRQRRRRRARMRARTRWGGAPPAPPLRGAPATTPPLPARERPAGRGSRQRRSCASATSAARPPRRGALRAPRRPPSAPAAARAGSATARGHPEPHRGPRAALAAPARHRSSPPAGAAPPTL
jgi:hypothetical protein